MAVKMKLLMKCIISPRLYKIYKDGPQDSMYQPLPLERWADKVITSTSTIFNIGMYTSPFICMYIYKKGLSVIEENKYGLLRFFSGLGCLLALSFVLRGVGRVYNQKYIDFINALTGPMVDKKTYLNELRKYDFEFHAWPTTYTVAMKPSESWLSKFSFNKTCANSDLPLYQRAPLKVLAFIATHAFGLRLIYPGSLGIVANMFWTPLFQGRAQLVENYNGQRAKLRTAEGNYIDTMFVDKRGQYSNKGKILVVCCEGNSGFYEIGIMTTPVRAGYSAIGWNHPGFAGSTGLPYPCQEENAIDAVLQYSINELKFLPEHIIMYGWSIGGYTATWAAVNYPVKGLVLDATFDDLLPLARNVMPSSWSLLVKEVVRSHVDLHVAELIKKYQGAVQLIRRTDDEIICLSPGNLATNRGNELLATLIEHRHPLEDGLDATAWLLALWKHINVAEGKRPLATVVALTEYDRRAIKLIGKYMRDYQSTHCTPLPVDHFESVMRNIESGACSAEPRIANEE
ncbi:phosphatidylserine lipase ABHD16A isoform X2 [Plodia interpunctella]|nr:phosphatidylserine lipase ABHD16A isoform X2 [Plodia interpunctella]